MTAQTGPDLTAEHEAAVGRAISAMRQSLYQAVRLDDHAAAGLYSRYHFHRVFRQVTGTTPARYLAGLRMQRAKQLLAGSDLTVTTISGMVGYESLGTFTTQFGRLVGVSPGRFRQLAEWCRTRTTLHDLELASTPPESLCRRSGMADPGEWTVFAGLFEDGRLSGAPVAFALLPRLTGQLLHRFQTAQPPLAALALAVPSRTRLVDLALGSLPEILVGPASVPVCDDLGRGRLHVHLRPLRELDPPAVSAAAVQYLTAIPTGEAARPRSLAAPRRN